MKRIAYLCDGVRSDWSLLSWRGMVERARERGVSLSFLDGQKVLEPASHLSQNNVVYSLVTPRRFDVLISWHAVLVLYLTDDQSQQWYERIGLPTVLIEGRIPGRPHIEYANGVGIEGLVDHLISAHGLRTLGFVGHTEAHPGFRDRYQSYCRALERHGLAVNPALVKPLWEFTSEQANGVIAPEVLDPWLRSALEAGVQALVCVTDVIAILVISRLEALGLRVPEDVAVTGFDGQSDSLAVIPPLTTVRPDWRAIGRRALDRAVDLADGRSDPESERLPVEVVIRRSCGCPDRLVEAVGRPEADPGVPVPPETLLGVPGEDWAPAGWLAQLDRELRLGERADADLAKWHAALGYWEGRVDGLFSSAASRERAQRRLRVARVLVGNHAEHKLRYRNYLRNQRRLAQRRFERQLVTKLDLTALGEVMREGLPGLGIPAAWIVLFDDSSPYRFPAPAPRQARLVIAAGGGGAELPEGGKEFDPTQLLPEPWFDPERAESYFVRALYVEDTSLGYAVFQVGTDDAALYSSVATQISLALHGHRLVQQVQAHNRQLAENLEELRLSQARLVRQEKMALLGTLVAGVARDLSTPLEAATTGAQTLLSQIATLGLGAPVGPPEATIDDVAEGLAASIQRLTQLLERATGLIGGIGDVSLDSVGDLKRRFSLRDCLDQAVAALQPLLEQRGLVLHWSCPDLVLEGDPLVYSRVVTDLLLTVETRAESAGSGIPIHLVIEQMGESLVFEASAADSQCLRVELPRGSGAWM